MNPDDFFWTTSRITRKYKGNPIEGRRMKLVAGIVGGATILSLMATATYAADAEMIRARQEFFGKENVDVETG